MDLIKRIDKLINVVRNNTEDLSLVESSLKTFPDYIDSIIKMEVGIKMARIRANSQEELVEEIQRLDRNRHYCHNSAIMSAKVLNRLCDMYGVEKIYKGDVDCRQQVADFAKEIVDTHYIIRLK